MKQKQKQKKEKFQVNQKNKLKKSRFVSVLFAACIVFLAVPLTVRADSNNTGVQSGIGDSAAENLYAPAPSSHGILSNALNIIRNTMELKKTALVNTDITFTAEEFENLLGVKKVSNIVIKSLPDVSVGVLVIGNQDVKENQVISRDNIKYLRVIPYPDRLGKIQFTFNNFDDESIESGNVSGSANSMQSELDIKCTISVLDSLNFAPTASSVSVTTQKNISAVKMMKATEPDNDSVKYSIVTSPKKGKIIVTDSANGNFVYQPNNNFTGKDKFEYVVEDEYGNISNKAVVDIRVVKPEANVYFSDLKNHWVHNSAIKAVAAGMVEVDNTQLNLKFYPESLVTRAEFVKMAVIAANQHKNLEKVYNTGFADDMDIPLDLKAYIKKAHDLGYVKGTLTDTGTYFNPNSILTRAEAAVIINKIANIPTANLSTGLSTGIKDAIAIPAWAASDINALYVNGIINGTGDGRINADGLVDKAQAIELLCNMREYSNIKAKNGGFLSFLFN